MLNSQDHGNSRFSKVIKTEPLTGAFQRRPFFIIIYFNFKWVFARWQWYYNKTQHTNNTLILIHDLPIFMSNIYGNSGKV
jgi:glycosidase